MGDKREHNKDAPPVHEEKNQGGDTGNPVELAGKTGQLTFNLDDQARSLLGTCFNESEIEYRRLVESLNDEYFFYSHDTEGVFKYVSPSIKSVLGYDQHEFLTHYSEYLTSNSVNSDVDRHTELSIKGRVQPTYELEIYHKDGSTRWLEVKETPVFDDLGNVISVEGIAHDISGRKRTEQDQEVLRAQFQQSQKMEAIGILAAGVAHDFNNILTTIGLHSEIAMNEVGPGHIAYNSMMETFKASRTASELTRQLLLFSRKEAMSFETGDLNIIVAGLLKMLGRLIGEDIQIKTDLDAALKTTFFDKGSMEQVLMNLSVNARDALAEGGSITIKTRNVTLGRKECEGRIGARPGEYICLSICDSGAGMDDETKAHIFEPFYTTKLAGKGTGLGLSVVYSMVKQHNGWVEVQSAPGRGTEFSLYFPVQKEVIKKVSVEREAEQRLMGDGVRVLFIEDDPNVRDGVMKILVRSGFEVLEAENVQKACSIFDREKGSIDLVLSDVILPDGTGLELVEEFLRVSPELKVLLSSGYTDEKSQWPIIQERKYDFIQKPYSVSELLAAVEKALEKE